MFRVFSIINLKFLTFGQKRIENLLHLWHFFPMKWLPLIIMILYFFSPLDLIPDTFFPAGFLDDLLVILVLISGSPFLKKFFSGYLKKFFRVPPSLEEETPSEEEASFEEKGEDQGKKSSVKSPWEILGVSQEAPLEEIKEAYRKRCAEYHPDKVAHLGLELQKVAHEEFKKIQAAYEYVKKQR